MRACIFDLDGTLIDSTHVWAHVDAEFFAKRGMVMPPDYPDAIVSMNYVGTAEYTIKRFGFQDSVEALKQEWIDMAIDAYANRVPLKPYALEYLSALKAQGIKLAVASSLTPVLREVVLCKHGIKELFDVICGTEEAGLDKTTPDIFLMAAQKLNTRPEDCVVFEDIPRAAQCAKDAGMVVYGIYDEAVKEQWAAMRRIADGALYDFKDAPLP